MLLSTDFVEQNPNRAEIYQLGKGACLSSVMETKSNIYDGCEFDENQNVDWDALEITEELALQIGGPSQLLGSFHESSRKNPRDGRHEEEDENESIKFMRFGSLGRIIASSVVASTPPGTFYMSKPIQTSSVQNDLLRCEYIKKTTIKFIDAFNFGDMGRLALLVRELCAETCLLITPDVDHWDCIIGRANVMMLFSLIIETFPDGVYRIISSNVEGDQVTVVYSFTGTRVFEQSIDCLYKQCRKHAAEGSVGFEGSSKPENFSCDLDLIQISKTTTQNFSLDLNRKVSLPTSSESLQKGHYNPFQSLQHKFSETVTHLLPHAGRLASEALKEGPIKKKRSMEMHFNSDDQIVKIIFVDLNSVPFR